MDTGFQVTNGVVPPMISGHVTICKIYKDGTKEVVLDKANLVTAGLGSAFLDIQMGGGSTNSSDYAPHYFQVGTGSIDYDTSPAREASSTFYQLSAPLHWSSYGEDTDLVIDKQYRGFNASTENTTAPYSYTELLNTSASLSAVVFSGLDQYFAKVRRGSVTKFFMDSFESEIVLDENTANGISISEVGLFAKNPKGFNQDSPLLMAYKNFTAIPKTSDISLVFHWNIGFLGISNLVDNYYKGVPSPPTDDPNFGLTLGIQTR